MALPDLTGLNIENTYQRLIQTDGISFYDGTGSIVNIGGSQNLQQVTEQGSSTNLTITASAKLAISASGTGSFGHIKATIVEGNSPLTLKDVGEVNFDNANLYGNPIFHGDVNVYSGAAFLDQIDAVIFRSTNTTIPTDGLLQLGDNSTPTELHGSNIKLTSTLTASIVSASAITASIHGGTF
jgi:hypothetical protein